MIIAVLILLAVVLVSTIAYVNIKYPSNSGLSDENIYLGNFADDELERELDIINRCPGCHHLDWTRWRWHREEKYY